MSIKGAQARPERLAWTAAILGLVLLAAAIGLGKMGNAITLIPAAVAAAMAMTASFLAVAQANLSRRCAEEEDALRDFRAEHKSTELFEDADEALQLAKRARQTFEKYFLPIFSAVLGAAVVTTAVLFWLAWNKEVVFPLAKQPLPAAAMAIGCMILALVAASYFSGVSREPGCRFLRPAGAWLYFTAALFAAAAFVFLCQHAADNPTVFDPKAGRIAALLVIALGVEMVLGVIIDYYRPRHRLTESRPIFESRLLSVLTEPGGVAQNVAAALDYQFGFKVSEAWFYRFLERTVMPLAVTMLVFLWLLSCIVVVDTEEKGIRELFGSVTSRQALEPGLYWKLPAPFARINKFPVERVQQVPVGYAHEDENAKADDPGEDELMGDLTGRIVIWSKKHYKFENSFVVASAPEGNEEMPAETGGGELRTPVSAYFLSASMPVYYKVNDLYAYKYEHQDPETTLKNLATRQVVKFLAGVDFFQILSRERAQGRDILKKMIQDAADEAGIGVEIVFVGLQGLHPPVNVGAAYDEVVAAMEEKHTSSLTAETSSIKSKIEIEGKAAALVAQARGYRDTRVRVAEAESLRFGKQLLAYNASPSVFSLRSYLDVLENEGAKLRKYVVATKSGHEVIVLNLENKLRKDLLDLDIDNTDIY